MTRTVLMTGGTGALGPHVLAELLRREEIAQVFVLIRGRDWTFQQREFVTRTAVSRLLAEEAGGDGVRPGRLVFLGSDVRERDLGLTRRDADMLAGAVDVVVHAAANTGLTAPLDHLRAINVDGTRHMLDFAARCRSLRQFLLVSTVCVAGSRTGSIAERIEEEAPPFVNAYEQTKWEAEREAAARASPVRIARLSVCMGGQHTGYVHRYGAIHHSLRWLTRGLIPMMPGAPGCRIDVIANDVAAKWMARASLQDVERLDVCHVAAGAQAPALEALLTAAVERLRSGGHGRPVDVPLIVDRETFDLFRQSIERSGDLLFTRVLNTAATFLPLLLYAKVFETDRAERCWGGPLPHPDWRTVLARVIDFGCAHHWSDEQAQVSHV
jgi:nucleoside-diphosphate-sugar epimerase